MVSFTCDINLGWLHSILLLLIKVFSTIIWYILHQHETCIITAYDSGLPIIDDFDVWSSLVIFGTHENTLSITWNRKISSVCNNFFLFIHVFLQHFIQFDSFFNGIVWLIIHLNCLAIKWCNNNYNNNNTIIFIFITNTGQINDIF